MKKLKILEETRKSNLVLMGLPGSGKTTLGKILAKMLGMEWFDIDDHHLEKEWNCTVSQKLAELGDEAFIKEEGETTMRIKKKNTVISLTGSNPLYDKCLQYIKQDGFIIFLDADKRDVLNRLKMMKVSRIVGQMNNSIEFILDYRKQFYEKYFDKWVIVDNNCDFEKLAEDLIKEFNSFDYSFISTRGRIDNFIFSDVCLRSLSQDGGLFLPSYFPPPIKHYEIERLLDMDYRQRFLYILQKFLFQNELSPQMLRKFVFDSFSSINFGSDDILDVSKLENNIYILEMYNGPTASFKDLALQFTPKLINWSYNQSLNTIIDDKGKSYYKNIANPRLALMVATSGDTGSAAIDGFNKEKIPTIILFPNDGVSEIQKRQMTTCDNKNNLILQINADFDYCQSLVKKLFNSEMFLERLSKIGIHLTSGNSINWSRLLPQVFYTINGYLQMLKKGFIKNGNKIDVCIPTGNFGNLLGAYYAQQIGLPIRNLICASNSNNILHEVIQTGKYNIEKRTLIETSSPSIDILISSNFERFLFCLLKNSGKFTQVQCFEIIKKNFLDLQNFKKFQLDENILLLLQKHIKSDFCDENEVLNVIRNIFYDFKVIIDPHTAVGLGVAYKYLESLRQEKNDKNNSKNHFDKVHNNIVPILVASTAHWTKFPIVIDNAIFKMETLKECKNQELLLSKFLFDKCQKFEGFDKEKNEIHSNIEKLFSRKITQTNILEPDQKLIEDKIINFLETLNKNNYI